MLAPLLLEALPLEAPEKAAGGVGRGRVVLGLERGAPSGDGDGDGDADKDDVEVGGGARVERGRRAVVAAAPEGRGTARSIMPTAGALRRAGGGLAAARAGASIGTFFFCGTRLGSSKRPSQLEKRRIGRRRG
jgi:hypothetical protein